MSSRYEQLYIMPHISQNKRFVQLVFVTLRVYTVTFTGKIPLCFLSLAQRFTQMQLASHEHVFTLRVAEGLEESKPSLLIKVFFPPIFCGINTTEQSFHKKPSLTSKRP